MSTQSNRETAEYLTYFTSKEEELLARVKNRDLMPLRLADWRTWIGDPNIYLNELKAYVERGEQ